MKILLKDIIEKRELSYRKLEILTGIPKSTMMRIASGAVSPSMENMEKIAKGLKIRINELFDSVYR